MVSNKINVFFMTKSHVHFMSTKVFKVLEALVTIDNSKNSTKSYLKAISYTARFFTFTKNLNTARTPTEMKQKLLF